MKRFYLIIILTINTFTLTAQPSDSIDWNAVINDYYTKYQPQQSPAWLFPIIFEEGTGQRDTIYLGFDDEASGMYDTLLGEQFRIVDTTKFHAYFLENNLSNNLEVLKVYMTKTNGGLSNNGLTFFNAKTPLKTYWNKSLFYHDSLQLFISDTLNHSVVPYLYGLLTIGDYFKSPEGNCTYWSNPYICDTFPYPHGCIREDSITQISSLYPDSSVTIEGMHFLLTPWYGLLLNNENIKSLSPKIYPNPTSNVINIELDNIFEFKVTVNNILGQQLHEMNATSDKITVDLSSFPKGIYFLRIQVDEYKIKVIKIMKQ